VIKVTYLTMLAKRVDASKLRRLRRAIPSGSPAPSGRE
jgi:hypothetical protein